jgi:predicted acetyltransferase
MTDGGIKLVRANLALRDEFIDMAREWLGAGSERYRPAIDDFAGYIARSDRYHAGDVPEPSVPSTEYWLVNGARILGRVSVRHRLNESLAVEGGHIGYDIRPTERRKGYGTLILKLALEKAREKGIARVMVTCDSDNTGSVRIIEHNGGKLTAQRASLISGKQLNEYWIENNSGAR